MLVTATQFTTCICLAFQPNMADFYSKFPFLSDQNFSHFPKFSCKLCQLLCYIFGIFIPKWLFALLVFLFQLESMFIAVCVVWDSCMLTKALFSVWHFPINTTRMKAMESIWKPIRLIDTVCASYVSSDVMSCSFCHFSTCHLVQQVLPRFHVCLVFQVETYRLQ